MKRKTGYLNEAIPEEETRGNSWTNYEFKINRLIPGAVRLTNKAWGENAAMARQLWSNFYGDDDPGIDCFYHLAMDYLSSLNGLRRISPRRLMLAEDVFERGTFFVGGNC